MAFDFKNALIRTPSKSVASAISSKEISPDYGEILKEHSAYKDALKSIGLNVITLPPLEEFPDSMFVEDPALTFSNGCIVLRPGTKSRFGEKGSLALELANQFEIVLYVEEGTVEGGDVLRIGNHCIIGLSNRTDKAGANSLSEKLSKLGITSEIAITPSGVLHFKSDCCLLDESTIFCTEKLYETGFFEGKNYEIIKVPVGEEVAANSLRVNETLFVPNGFEKTDLLLSQRYDLRFLAVDEVGKVDAGLSCMSLRW